LTLKLLKMNVLLNQTSTIPSNKVWFKKKTFQINQPKIITQIIPNTLIKQKMTHPIFKIQNIRRVEWKLQEKYKMINKKILMF